MCGRERYLPCRISKEASWWILVSSCQWNQVTILTGGNRRLLAFQTFVPAPSAQPCQWKEKQGETQNMPRPLKTHGLLEHCISTWMACCPCSIRAQKQIHTQGYKICTCSSLLICRKNKTCYQQSLRNNFHKKMTVAHSQHNSDQLPSVTA